MGRSRPAPRPRRFRLGAPQPLHLAARSSTVATNAAMPGRCTRMTSKTAMGRSPCWPRSARCSLGCAMSSPMAAVGRRAGKSRALALVAVYLAAFVSWRPRLAAGEVGVIMVLAADRNQAGVLLGYVRGLIADNPMLAQLVTAEGVERIELGTLRVAIEEHTSSYRAVRGRTVIAALCDEVAFWRSMPTNRFGSADPHAEGRARTLRKPSPTPARASRHFRAAVRAQYGGTRSALACSGRGGRRSGYRWVRRCRRHPRASGIASRPAPPGTGMGSRCGSEHRSAGSGAWPRAACAWG